MGNLVVGAYLLPDSTKYKAKYTYKDYVNEALRITKIFFINSATKMSPNMNYGQIVPIGPVTATSAADYKIDSTTMGRGEGMITFTEYSQLILDYLLLLEELPKVQTMDTSLSTDIATTIASVREWYKSFGTWMYSSGIGHDELYHPNNHGSWFVSAFSLIAVFTKDATLQSQAKTYIQNYAVDNTGKTESFYASEWATTFTGQTPSFYTQLSATGEQQLEVTRGLSFDYEMFGINGLINIGYAAKKLGVTFDNGKSTFFNYRISTYNVGIPEAASLLYSKYLSGSYVSYGSIDYSKLARVLYKLGRISELAAYDFSTKGDYVYTDSTKNSTVIYSDAVRAINVGLF